MGKWLLLLTCCWTTVPIVDCKVAPAQAIVTQRQSSWVDSGHVAPALQANKNVVRKYVEKFNAGDFLGLTDIFADDALVHGIMGWGKVGDVIPMWEQLMDGLAIRLEIESIIAEGDIVAVRYLERGASRTPIFDRPATGKSYEVVAMEWFEVKEGKIQRRWGARNTASQAKQLGWDVTATRVMVPAMAK